MNDPKFNSENNPQTRLKDWKDWRKVCLIINLIFFLIFYGVFIYFVSFCPGRPSHSCYSYSDLGPGGVLILFPFILITSIIGIIYSSKIYKVEKTGLAYLIYFIFALILIICSPQLIIFQ